ncbi:MAG: serine protease Do [Gammaproteobacteria bacterium]|jgi:serine protease Do
MKSAIDDNKPYFGSGRATDDEIKRYNRYIEKYDHYRESHDNNTGNFRDQEKQYKRTKSEFDFDSSISNFAKSFKVVLKNGKKYRAKLIKLSKDHDLALLKLDNYKTPFLKLTSKPYPRQGSEVFAIGNPLGISDSLTTGIVTTPGRDHIYTDAKILSGNSGGPLVDKEGRVIGVNTAVLSEKKGSDGLGLAVYVKFVKSEYRKYLPSNF